GLVGQEPAGCVRVLASAGYTGRPRCPPSNTANYPTALTRASAADLHLVTTPAASAVHRTRVGLAAVPISPGPGLPGEGGPHAPHPQDRRGGQRQSGQPARAAPRRGPGPRL